MTTYVLGAGASKDMGYPLARTMGKDLAAWMRRQTPTEMHDFPSAVKALEMRFGELDDIELLLTEMDALIAKRQGGTVEEVQVASLLVHRDKPEIINAIRGWFDEIRERDAISYKLFASQVITAGDAVITFNYDVSLDRELRATGVWMLGDGYGFAVDDFGQGSSVLLLKLHGSINLFSSLLGGMKSGARVIGPGGAFGTRPVFFNPELEFLGYSGMSDPLLSGSGSSGTWPLILPTRCKNFYFDTNLGREWEGFWDSLWRSAATQLALSNRIVICGYSLPEVDERACKLLMVDMAHSVEIEVCCGGDTDGIVRRFVAAGYKATGSAQRHFGDWVRAQIES